MSPEAQLNAIDEAKEVFRSAVQELRARAARLGIIHDATFLLAEDILTDLFFKKEEALKKEIGE